ELSDFTGQNNWRWCSRCQGLAFAGYSAGACPAGGGHDFSRSVDYTLIMGTTTFAGQNQWRCCRNCHGLVYAGSSSRGVCPGPSRSHDTSGSADYTLFEFGSSEPFLVGSWGAGQQWADLGRGLSIIVKSIDPASFTATILI